MKRFVLIMLGWLLLTPLVCAGPDAAPEDKQLQNAWEEERHDDGSIMLVSKYPAPVPFSMNGEPEAVLSMDAEAIPPGKYALEDIVEEQVRDIRKAFLLADYEEEDDGRKPVNGIAVWYEDIHGTRVAFIKYRARGLVEKPTALPMTAIHSILVRDDRIFLTQLIVRFAGHQDEVRHDQRVMIRSMIDAQLRRKAQGK